MKRKLPLIFILLTACTLVLKAQSIYRSAGTGVTVDLGSATNWETFDGTNWISATSAPNALASGSTITIQAGDVWQNNTSATSIPTGVTLTNYSSATLGTFSTSNRITCNGELVYAGTAAQVLPPSAAFISSTITDITINNTAGVSTNGTLSVKGVINLIAGQFNCNNGGGSLNYKGSMSGSGGVMNVAGNFFTQGTTPQVIDGTVLLNNTINKLNVNTTTSGLIDYSSTGPIKISSGIGLYAGVFTLGGTLTVAGTTITAASNAGGITAGSNMVTFMASTAQTIPTGFFTGNTVNDLTISNSAGVTSAGALSIGDSYTIANLKTGVTPLSVTGTATISGALTISSFAATPTSGQQYTILSGTAVSGTFSSIVLPNGYTGTLAYSATDVKLTVTPSSNADLSSLSLSAGTLSPVFDPAVVSYTVTVPNATSTISLTPTLSDASATMKVDGSTLASGSASSAISLTVGSNTIDVVVTAFDGTVKTYTIAVTRAALSTDATLSALVLSDGTLSPAFSSAGVSYTATVPNATSSITVTPTVNDATATVTVNSNAVTSGSASSPIALNVGSNTITVVVTAEDASTKTYTIMVTRTPLSTDATLSNLTISSGSLSPVFASGTNNYTTSVDNGISSITVTPTVNDATATVTVNGNTVSSGSASGNIALNVGSNTITVLVTAQDGTTTQTYTVNVTRAASSNADLSSLDISSGTLTPVFAASTTAYTASVDNSVTSVTVTPTLSDATATVTVNGNTVVSGNASLAISLNVGANTITNEVIAQDGTVKDYIITVTRAASSNADLSGLDISSGTLTPGFSAATTSYAAGVSITTSYITVTPTVADATAAVTVNGTPVTSGSASGNITINTGSNTITTVVTAQNGTTKTYTLTISKTALSTNADLSSLALSAGSLSPTFDPGTLSYTASVSNATTSLTVTPTIADATATVTVNGTPVTSGSVSGSIALSTGSNTISTVVTAQDGITQKTYTVTVDRALPSSNADLSNLSISSGTLSPVFASTTNSYTVSVSNTTTSITVTPTVADATATVTVNGTAVVSGAASAPQTLAVGDNTMSVVVTAQNGTTINTYSIVVNRPGAPQTITFNALANVTYGDGDFTPVASSTNNTIAITFTSSNTNVATITSGGEVHIVGAGNTTITASQSGNSIYDAATPVPQNLTVNPATLTVTANNATKIYGAANPALSVNYTGFVNGETSAVITTQPTVTTTATTASAVNTYPVTASGAVAADYTFSYVPATLTVTKAPLTIAAVNASKVYGAVLPTLNVTYTGFVNGDTQAGLTTQPTASTTATTASAVGTYPITANGAASSNYSIAYTNGLLTVTTAPLTITANNSVTTYGSVAPALTATYSGFVNGETQSVLTTQPVLGTSYTTTSAAGTYPVTVSGAVAANYNMSYVAGVLTVGKAVLTVTANDATKIYGAVNPTLSASYSGFLNGDGTAQLTTQPTVSTTATTTSATGTYPVTVTGGAAANYSLTYVAGTLTITPATRTFAFGTMPAHTYGDADFSAGATVNTGETISYATSDPNVATIVNGLVHIVNAGSVTITASIASNANYLDVQPISQAYTINRATQYISFATLPVIQVGGPVLSVSLTSNVGLPVTLSSSNPSIASINGQNITALSVGSVIITATQPGNINYLPATNSQFLKVQDATELVKVRAGLSPNGDGVNDFLVIEGIQDYPDNKLTIINRNGLKIFQSEGYNNLTNVFDGHSNINGDLLQAGTYFYDLELKVNGETKRKTGYLILKFN